MHAILRWLLILGCFLGVVAHTAHADPLAKPVSAEARSHLVRGNKLFGIRSFDQAVDEYKAGALIEAAPIFDYNLGLCFLQLGKYPEAIWHYERFITRGDPQGEVLDAVNGFLVQMKSELDKKAMTEKPTEPGPFNPSQELRPPPITPHAAQPPPENSVTQTARSPWSTPRRIALGIGATGVVGVATGVVFGVQTQGFKDDASRLCPTNACDDADKASKANALTDRAAKRATLGNISVGMGAGMIVGAAILWYAGGAASPSRTDSAIIPHLTPTLAGVVCHGRF
jgi:tetratricopeptide (TPR) repeat protein